MSNSLEHKTTTILCFGAHPDDIEFGCGGVIASETRAGRSAHFVVCSLGEASSNGTPEQRAGEARKAAECLGATIEFTDLETDAHLDQRAVHAIKLAAFIRRFRPSVVLAPSCVENQHPDHSKLGKIVRDACRVARYGGLKELITTPAFAIDQLFFYAVTPDGVPSGVTPVLIDVSPQATIDAWTAAMKAHASQSATRNYLDLQLNRARVLGAQAGLEFAIALYPNDPMVFESLSQAGKGARRF